MSNNGFRLFLLLYFGGACLYTGKTLPQIGLILLFLCVPGLVEEIAGSADKALRRRPRTRKLVDTSCTIIQYLAMAWVFAAPWVL